MGTPYFQSVKKSIEGEGLNEKIEKLADAEQERFLKQHGKPLDRNDARSAVLKANPDLSQEFISKSYKG
jgi:hypothetical protein